jgi:hypothetical protein
MVDVFAKYCALKEENKQLKLLIQKMFSGLDDYWMTTLEGSDVCREARSVLKGDTE